MSTSTKKPLDVALTAALADVGDTSVAEALDKAARQHSAVEPYALGRACSLAGSILGRVLHAREIAALDNCLALVRAQLLLHPILRPQEDACDECGAPYRDGAESMIGAFHAPHCSLFVGA